MVLQGSMVHAQQRAADESASYDQYDNIHAMGEPQQLKLEAIEALISARDVNDLSIREIMADILDDEQMAAFLPRIGLRFRLGHE